MLLQGSLGSLLLGSLLAVTGVQSCPSPPKEQIEAAIRANIAARARAQEEHPRATSGQIAIENVRVFTGTNLSALQTVYINNGLISTEQPGASTTVFNGNGGTLLPGLIDSHCHPLQTSDIQNLTTWGVTTAFSMASFTKAQCGSLQSHPGLSDIHCSSAPACNPNSTHGLLVEANSNNDTSLLVQNATDVTRWITEQLTWDPEFIKIISETPNGMDQGTLNNLVNQSHNAKKKVICHTGTLASHQLAINSLADQIHHTTSDIQATKALANQIKSQGQINVPTLSIMKAFAATAPGRNFSASLATTKLYYDTGVTMLVGTDANAAVANVPFGISVHDEFELLTQAGIPSLDILNSATSIPAKIWGLTDRGVIANGKRADLVLINGDPIANITTTRNIQAVWVAGQQYVPST